MKRRMMAALLIIACTVMAAGCSKSGSPAQPSASGEPETAAAAEQVQDAKDFLQEQFGYTDDELDGIDAEALVNDYDMRNETYTREEVDAILAEYRGVYTVTDEDKIYEILGNTDDDCSDSPDLPADAQITKAALYISSVSSQNKYLFDFEEHCYYVNDANVRFMTQNQEERLLKAFRNAHIENWPHYTDNTETEAETTGSFGFKIALQIADGTVCSYGGYTKDMTGLPNGFDGIYATVAGF